MVFTNKTFFPKCLLRKITKFAVKIICSLKIEKKGNFQKITDKCLSLKRSVFKIS